MERLLAQLQDCNDNRNGHDNHRNHHSHDNHEHHDDDGTCWCSAASILSRRAVKKSVGVCDLSRVASAVGLAIRVVAVALASAPSASSA